MSMIHACIENNQGLKIYTTKVLKKKTLVQWPQRQNPTLDELYNIMNLQHVRATLPPNPNKSTYQI
jgi:hypothetical protein